MSVLSWLGFEKSDEEKDAEQADAAKASEGNTAAIALSNYRQTARDQYNRLLNSEMTPYQAYSNRLAAGWGQGMSNANLNPDQNPVTLADTGVGAAKGSNFTGWDEATPGNGVEAHQSIHHTGIGEYLNGTAQPNGPGQITPFPNAGDRAPDGSLYRSTMQTFYVPAVAGGVPQQPTYNPGMTSQLQPGGGAPMPGAGMSFAPRRP